MLRRERGMRLDAKKRVRAAGGDDAAAGGACCGRARDGGRCRDRRERTGREPFADRGYRHSVRRVELRRARLHRRREPGRDPGGAASGEHFRVLDDRPRRLGGEPPELCARPAALGARLRRAIELRCARRAAVLRRHPGHHAGRAGGILAIRFGLRRPHGGVAGSVLRAVRQFLRRGDLAVHRGGARRLLHRRHRAIWHVRYAALRAEEHG